MSPLLKFKVSDPAAAKHLGAFSLKISRLVSELILIAACWYAVDAFIYLRLSPAGFIATYATWAIVFPLILWLRGRVPLRRGMGGALEFGLPALILSLISPHLRHELTGREILFATAWMYGLSQVWRRWPFPLSASPITELLRRLLLIVIPYLLFIPFITDREVGGVDARWYANMLADFIEQSRAGVFPVFIGQGFHAYNGAVHPFRSAPMFMWVSGIWDVVTFRSLPIYSLQHLTALSTGVAATMGMYLALTGLNPRHRWAAFCLSILYITSPAILGALHGSEMYMTWMSIAALPWVMYGNARIILLCDRPGWLALSASLVITWMCHPPVALLATLISIVFQVIILCSCRIDGRMLKNVGWSAFTFIVLGGYYFVSMSEVPRPSQTNPAIDLMFIAGVAAVLLSALRGFFQRKWIWLSLYPVGLLFLYLSIPIWTVWGGIFILLVGLFSFLPGRGFDRRRKDSLIRAAFAAALLAAAVTWPIAQGYGLAGNVGSMAVLDEYTYYRLGFFLPISRNLNVPSDFQPGLAIWLSLVFGLYVVWKGRRGPASAFILGATLMVIFFIRIPGVSDFFVGFAPLDVAAIASFPLVIRLLPPCIAVICVGTCLSWSSRCCGFRARVLNTALAVLLLGWSLWETRYLLVHAMSVTSPRALTARHLLSENIKLERFAYDLLPLPEYFSNGPTDPRLENRLIDGDQRIVFGETQLAHKIEQKSGGRELHLMSRLDDTSSDWIKIEPKLTVRPGENMLLRFSFPDGLNYTGVLVFTGNQGDYREYILPEVGLSRAFGVENSFPKVLSLWNSGTTPCEYRLSFVRGVGNDLKVDTEFATVFISPYKPEDSPIELKSLIPYVARVTVEKSGYLETPRVFLPGYRAKIDDQSVAVLRSDQNLVMIPVSPGAHQIEIKYVGSAKLWLAASGSGLGWLGFFGLILRQCYLRFRKRRNRSKDLLPTVVGHDSA